MVIIRFLLNLIMCGSLGLFMASIILPGGWTVPIVSLVVMLISMAIALLLENNYDKNHRK